MIRNRIHTSDYWIGIRIQEAQKHVDPVDPDSAPQPCLELLAMHEGLELEAGSILILLLPEADLGRGDRRQLHPGGGVGKNPGLKKTQPSGFFFFFFFFLNICLEESF
jgi:hypothetical protein